MARRFFPVGNEEQVAELTDGGKIESLRIPGIPIFHPGTSSLGFCLISRLDDHASRFVPSVSQQDPIHRISPLSSPSQN
jgi:hypothetical protein